MRSGNEIPVDWLAAKGMTSGQNNTQQELIEAPEEWVRNQAGKVKHQTGVRHSIALNVVAQSLGFKHYSHYVDHMKNTGQWLGRDGLKEKKKTMAIARFEADRHTNTDKIYWHC